jgi:hypothetical protein
MSILLRMGNQRPEVTQIAAEFPGRQSTGELAVEPLGLPIDGDQSLEKRFQIEGGQMLIHVRPT